MLFMYVCATSFIEGKKTGTSEVYFVRRTKTQIELTPFVLLILPSNCPGGLTSYILDEECEQARQCITQLA